MTVLNYQVELQKKRIIANKRDFSYAEMVQLLNEKYAIKVARREWGGTLYMKQNAYNPLKFTLYGVKNQTFTKDHVVFGICELNGEDKKYNDWYVIEWHE